MLILAGVGLSALFNHFKDLVLLQDLHSEDGCLSLFNDFSAHLDSFSVCITFRIVLSRVEELRVAVDLSLNLLCHNQLCELFLYTFH